MKTTKKSDYHVRAYPKVWGVRTNEKEQAECGCISTAIKRHVDDVESVEITCETEEVCEHCEAEWTETSDTYNGGCCTKDRENDPEDPTDD